MVEHDHRDARDEYDEYDEYDCPNDDGGPGAYVDSALLASIASGGLGRWVELEDGTRKYLKDDDCVACLKDLQGFFRHDDPVERHAFFAIHKYNFAKTDLVPLLLTYPDDYDVIYNTLKVCTHLTMQSSDISPALVGRQFEAMQQVCEAFTAEEGTIEVIMTLLAEPLSKHPKMKDRDASLVELVIIFLRNLVSAIKSVQQEASFRQKEAVRSIHAELLRRFQEADVLDLLVTVAQHARERPFRSQASVLLEIFLNVFQFTLPEQLVDIPSIESVIAKRTSQLPQLSAEERLKNRKKAYQTAPRLPSSGPQRTVTRYGPARQQFAGAVFMRRHMDHSSDVLVRHSPAAQELPGMSQAPNKKFAKSQKKKQYDEECQVDSSMILSERDVKLLHWKRSLLEKFLLDAYTPLVGQVFKEAKPGLDISRMEEDEFERFVRFVCFCTKFVRLTEEKKLIRKLKRNGEQNGDLGLDDDADTGTRNGGGSNNDGNQDTSPFASISSTMGWDAFHMVQVLFLICVEREVQRAKDKEQPYRSHVLLYSLGPLLREMLMTLDLARIAGNDADKQAADRLQRKLLHNDDRTGMLQVLTTLIREYKYHLHPRSHAIHLAEVLHVVLATLDRLTAKGSFQVSKAVKKHKKRSKKNANAATLQSKDGPGASADEAAAEENEKDTPPVPVEHDKDHVEDEEKAEDISSEEEDYVVQEHAFDASRRLRSACAHPQIVQFYVWLLQSYRKNSNLTNDAIVSYLERLAGPAPNGMGLHCMLWQLSVVRTFHAIMSDNAVHKDPKYRRMLKLCFFVIRGLFERLCPDLSEYEKRIEEASTKQKNLEQDLEDLRLVHLGEEGADAKLDEVRRDIEKVKTEAHEAQVEMKVKEECASLAFVELLFAKLPTVAESISDEYNWKRYVSMQSDAQDGTQLGFASYRATKPGEFTEEQTGMLVDFFENCNGRKDYLSQLVFEFGGAFKKVHISRKLKELGLEKGKLTTRQRDMLFILAERYADKPTNERYETIREQLGGGFTARQIKSQMRNLGLIKGGPKKGARTNSNASDAGESEDTDGFDSNSESDLPDSPDSDLEEQAMDAEKAFDDLLAEIDDDEKNGGGDTRDHTISDTIPAAEAAPPGNPSTNTLTKQNKRKDVADEQDDASRAEARRKALELLRKRHHKSGGDEGPMAPPAQENADTNTSEPSSPVKTYGRRLLKKGVAETQESQAVNAGSAFDELMDF
jgi:hypothetical protein